MKLSETCPLISRLSEWQKDTHTASIARPQFNTFMGDVYPENFKLRRLFVK